jgi:hypothetical protein
MITKNTYNINNINYIDNIHNKITPHCEESVKIQD